MMRKKATRKIILFFFLLAATVICTMTACDSRGLRVGHEEIHSVSGQASPPSSERSSVAKKTVSHSLGQTEIPLHPKRIVVLDPLNSFLLDGLLALGIKPVGLERCPGCIALDSFNDILGEIPSVGTGQQPSLEKILMLKPDLILGYEWQRSYYSQLSKIAPTVMIDISTGVRDFKRDFEQLAEILGKSDQVESILAEYNEKIQKFRQRFGEKLKSKTVSLLAFFSGNFHVIAPETLVHAQIMREAGIQFIPAYQNLKRNSQYNMSLEVLPDWDADFLLIGLIDKNPLEDLGPVFKQPLWSKLRAVRNDQVYILEKYFSGGPIGATQFVEDLYEYFSSKL